MKSIFFALLLTGAGVLSANAQSFKIIAEAGLDESTLGPTRNNITSASIERVTYSMRTGFHAGGYAEFAFGRFSVDPGLLFTQIGTGAEGTYTNSNPVFTNIYELKGTINYLELPVNVLYHFKLKSERSWFVGIGPYLGYGLSGTTREAAIGTFLNANGSTTNNQITNTMGDSFGTAGSSSDRLFTYGINALIGINLPKNFRVSGGYDFNISGPYFSSPKLYNHTLKLSLGYVFL